MSIVRKIHALLTPVERKQALILLCLMLVGMLLETLGVGLIVPVVALMMQQDLVDRYPAIYQLLNFIGDPTEAQLIVGAMLALAGIYFFKNLFLAFLTWKQLHFAFGVQVHLSERLFSTYLRLPYAFHLRQNSAQLYRNVSVEVAMFTAAIISALVIVTECLVATGIILLLLAIEPLGAMVVAIILGVATWVFYRATKTYILKWGELRQFHDGLRYQHLMQGLAGVKDVMLLGRETDFLFRFNTHNVESARVSRMQATLQQLPRLWLEMLAVLGLVLLVITMYGQGRNISSIIPVLGLFAAAAFRLMPSVNRFLAALQAVRYNIPAVNKLYEECNIAATKIITTASKELPTFCQEITLSNISYIYQLASSKAVDNISLTIKKGESVGLIGASGSGKSTLVDIILGLLEPTAGQVSVDGEDIQHNMRAWQDQIGYVPQSIYLTDDTLRRNVAFGLADNQIDDLAVKRAIKAAQLESFVEGLPDRLETKVGERGVRLSGGQRQRIGIARALYHDPAILVFDEATSALDIATEAEVMQAITALQGSKTMVIVAHRLATVESCNRVYRLEHGRLVEHGAPRDILIKKRKAATA